MSSVVERLPCCVPFCRRTTAAVRFDEWICAKHWSLVSPRSKARKRKIAGLLRRAERRGLNKPQIWTAAGRAWDTCKAEAVERAAGIA